MSDFKDHFSGHAELYRSFRPTYPNALFEAIAERAPGTRMAWDAGCGNGQASVGLARCFDRVCATDASAEQIAAAGSHPRIDFSVATAEASGLPPHCCDATLIAQALHWFAWDRFYDEVRRISKPGALAVAVCYELANVSGDIDALTLDFYKAEIGPYWPPDRAHIETRYRDIPWPFAPIAMPELAMRAEWTLAEWLGYLSTWSAVRRYAAATGKNPLPALRENLLPLWGDPRASRPISWPLTVIAGRVS